MVKWFVYIVFLLVLTPCLLSAKIKSRKGDPTVILQRPTVAAYIEITGISDTIKNGKNQPKAEIKVKEVAKAKRQPKPEKVDDAGQGDAKKDKHKRQRRPEGMERPPEIPRRNDN